MAGVNLKLLEEITRHLHGTGPKGPLEVRELASQAGHALASAHPWKWLEGRSLDFSPRPQILLTGATFTHATRELEETGAFADYEHVSGDTADITAGTGATLGRRLIQERVDDDTIILETSIGAAADGQTDIQATLANDQVLLPSAFDIQQITAYSMTNGLSGLLEPVSEQDMLDARSWGSLGSTVGFWSLVRHVRAASTTDGRPIPVLELWPQTSSEEQVLRIFYRAGWSDPASDEELLALPRSGWLNGLYIEFYKAVLMGHEEPENGSVDERLTKLRLGMMWRDAINRDATMQPDLGPISNGWLDGPVRIGRFDVPPPLIEV